MLLEEEFMSDAQVGMRGMDNVLSPMERARMDRGGHVRTTHTAPVAGVLERLEARIGEVQTARQTMAGIVAQLEGISTHCAAAGNLDDMRKLAAGWAVLNERLELELRSQFDSLNKPLHQS